MDYRRHYKVLIVDDEAKMRSLLRRVISHAGYETIEARSGKVALKIIRRHEPDVNVVVLDLAMPKIDGEELLLLFRREHPHIKIIIASVFPLEDQVELAASADDYFDKTNDLHILVEKINRVLTQVPAYAS